MTTIIDNPKLQHWAQRLAKALMETEHSKYVIDRNNLEELSELLDELNEEQQYGTI